MGVRLTRLATLATLATLAALAACTSEDTDPAAGATTPIPGADAGTPPSDGDAGSPDAAPTGAYAVEYVQVGGGLTVGKSLLQLRLTRRADGSAATGLASAIQIAPKMDMGAMAHGAPVPSDAVKESATPGTYDVTLFFSMASVDGSGNPLGKWTLGVSVGGEKAADLAASVAMPMGTDTTHKALMNATDKMMSMQGSASPRKYMLFRDTLGPGSGGHELGLFVATIQEGMMVWPPVAPGLELKDKGGNVQLTVASVEASVSTDGSTWTPMTCDAAARCRGALSGLSAGTAGKALVKLRINGKDYTTDGMAPDGQVDLAKTNAFATFTVTP